MSELITINKLELASELAHKEVVTRFEADDIQIYVDPTADELSYTEEAQDFFNVSYDYYLTYLESFKN